MVLTKRIIPCLDVKDGVVVKGVCFKNLKEVGDPPTLAIAYQDQGADEIVFLDVKASVSGAQTLRAAVRRTAEGLFIPLTVGGGIRSYDDVRETLKAGADKTSINSAAVEAPSLITRCADAFGSQCVVVAIDAKRAGDSWEVYTHSGTKPTGRDAIEWAEEVCELGAGEILLTSMDADGMKTGYDIELTRKVVRAVSVPVIASGGCGTIEHIAEVLTGGEADAALAASIFHYGEHTVGEVKDMLASKGVPVRRSVV
ncbi:MAG: imidazole glycerol phosphate synthase subunit HisF [Euryarchaeota archaeon RBG_16_62_10]|nr:MAG: imidazole glycerol phosphate synthase subunit HisF [Euryarchaeota archaeon RBG_16_62_10]